LWCSHFLAKSSLLKNKIPARELLSCGEKSICIFYSETILKLNHQKISQPKIAMIAANITRKPINNKLCFFVAGNKGFITITHTLPPLSS